MEGDADLVARIRSGDRESFDELYDAYADDVFSMCLLILGDPAVARAAAGTAFALVARTRLNPLTDPNRLRSWLLELARGSALAWSGSPQARSVPVPHGVSAEEMIEGAVVPAPASLRVGLSRTFDRAAIAAADRQPTHLGLSKVSNPDADVHDAPTEVGRGDRPARSAPALVDVGDGQPYDDHEASRTVVPFPRGPMAAGGPASAPAEWRTRPAITVAAALVLAVAGVTAAVSWPTSSNSISAEEFPDVAVVQPSPASATSGDVPNPPKAEAPALPLSVVPTVAGMFTSVPADERPDAVTSVPGVPSTTVPDQVAPPPPPPPPPTTDMPTDTEPPVEPTTDPDPSLPPTEPEPTTTDAPGPLPTDPTIDPTDPTVDPSDPTTQEPTEPTDPIEDPTDPTDPTDPIDPPPGDPVASGPIALPVVEV